MKSLQAKVININDSKITLEIEKADLKVAPQKTLKLYLGEDENGAIEDTRLAKIILEEILNGK